MQARIGRSQVVCPRHRDRYKGVKVARCWHEVDRTLRLGTNPVIMGSDGGGAWPTNATCKTCFFM